MSAISLTAYLGTTGLSDVGYRFIDATGAFTGTRQTTGVYELAGSRGIYGINTPTIPGDAVRVYWDSTGTAAVYAYETLDLYLSNYLNGNNETITGNVLCSVFTASTAFNALVFNAVTWNSNTAVNLGQITATNASNDIRLGGTEDGNIATAVWASGTRTLTSFGTLVADTAAAVWNALTSTLTTAGSIGKRLVDFVTTLVYAPCSGGGPKAVTIHTTDGTVALGGVSVTVLDASNVTQASGTTDGSGNFVANLLASTTYTINTYKSLYTSSPSSQTTSAGNGPQTLTTIALTIISIPTPSAPNKAVVTGTILAGSGAVVANSKGHMSLKAGPGKHRPLITSGNTLATSEVDFVTNGSGVVKAADGTSTLEVVRTNYVTQTDSTDANAYWEIDFPDIGVKGRAVYIAAANFDMSSIAAP